MTQSIDTAIAHIVRVECVKHDVPHKTAAQAAGMHLVSFSRKIRGERVFTLAELDAIAPLFDTIASDLVSMAELRTMAGAHP